MSDSALNAQIFTEMRELMDDALGEFITTYLTNSPLLIQKIKKGLDDNDAEAIFHAAHQLKGGSGSIGALKLADIAVTIEKIGRGGSTQGIAELLQQLQTEYTRLERELSAYK
jgi:HPt (histidine-containing phosphotransfer) domain-containing protein